MYKAVIYPMVGAAFLFGAGLASAETSTSKTTTTTITPTASNTASKTDAAKITLTEQQAKSWVDKPIYTSDGKQVGEVVSFKRGADNAVLEMQADIGGMLGMGETRVKIMSGQFKLQTDRVVLDMTKAQVKDLPKVKVDDAQRRRPREGAVFPSKRHRAATRHQNVARRGTRPRRCSIRPRPRRGDALISSPQALRFLDNLTRHWLCARSRRSVARWARRQVVRCHRKPLSHSRNKPHRAAFSGPPAVYAAALD